MKRWAAMTSYSASRCARIVVALAAIAAVFRLAQMLITLFHWAEHLIDRNSPWHMFLSFAVLLPFNLGLPIPLVHQAWAVAIGCFFRWRAFPILLAMLGVCVPVPFVIGRCLARRGGGSAPAPLSPWRGPWGQRAAAYLTPLRRAIAMRPVRSSFLLMWAPMPTSTLPLASRTGPRRPTSDAAPRVTPIPPRTPPRPSLSTLGVAAPNCLASVWQLAGFFMTSSELPLCAFVSGAFPSKFVHFALDVFIGGADHEHGLLR